MAFNGSGLFNIDSTGQPVSPNTLIESADFNALTADLATGLTTAICKDGQTTITANLPMAGYRHTGVGNASSRTDYAAAGQVQDGKLNWVDGGGTADAITATYVPSITALVDGQLCCVRATSANATTTPTFAPNGLTARTIVKKGGSALVAGDIVADGHELILRYDLTNTRWELLNPGRYASLGANAFTGLQQLDQSANIASGATVDLGTATGNTVTVTHSTGTTATTSLGGASLQAGTEVETIYSISGGTLSLTHHATNLILAGAANITLANGDTIRWKKMHDSNAEWKMVGGVKADGTAWVVAAVVNITLGTPVATTSGTSIDYTSIPAGTKRISINFVGVSTNGTSGLMIQIGDSGGVETSGYTGHCSNQGGGSVLTMSGGFTCYTPVVAANTHHGTLTITLEDSSDNTWCESGVLASNSATNPIAMSAGSKTLSATLDRIRITTVGGTDTFDAGEINISYEG